MKVVIIGGVAGGASAAARLRRLDEFAEIVLLERGAFISFANCGLPYYIGGEIEDEDELLLQTPESFNARFNVDVRVFNEAVSIDRENKCVKVVNGVTGEEYTESYDKLVIATGAAPRIPDALKIDSDKVFTVRNVPDALAIRKRVEAKRGGSAVVVGAGFIGLETAENLKLAGLDVTVVEMMDQILPPFDFEMAAEALGFLKDLGIKVCLGSGVAKAQDTGDKVAVTLADGRELAADIVISAAGVMPESDIAKSAGLAVGERGHIIVNDRMCTADADIYAVGDAVLIENAVTGMPSGIPLAGPANRQGRIAADNIAGLGRAYAGAIGTSIVKIGKKTAAMTGINERTAKALNLNYGKSYTFSPNHAGYYPGSQGMSVKIIYEKGTGKLLGAQLVGGEGTDKRCDVCATLIKLGGTIKDMAEIDLSYAPPYGSAKDPVNMAGYVADNIEAGRMKPVFWDEVADLPRDGSVMLVDVRTEGEYKAGTLEGFINIPLDDIRDRIDEFDKSKKIYVTCRIGLRGYVAQRILEQRGFEVYNLAGGHRFMDVIAKALAD